MTGTAVGIPRGGGPTRLDPRLLEFADGCAAQQAAYEGHFYIASTPEAASGIPFLEFFQTDKATGQPKGIVALDLRRLQL